MNQIATAAQGLLAAQGRFEGAANRVSTSGANYSPGDIVDLIESRMNFAAQVQVVRTADQMAGTLLDILS